MATTPENIAEQPDQRLQLSMAETAFDGKTTPDIREDGLNCPDEIIFITETSKTPVNPPDFKVKEAYVKTSTSKGESRINQNPPPTKEPSVSGLFSRIASTVQGLFRWRKLAANNSRVTPESGSTFLDAGGADKKESSKKVSRTDDMSMSRLGSNPEQATQMQSNQIFDQSLSSGLTQNGRDNEQYQSYESNIYSVNSAGNPIPITIENDRNDDTTDDSSSGKKKIFYPLEVK